MKKLLIAAAMIVSVAGFAQEKKEKPEGGRPPMEERLTPEEHTKRLTKDLNLNAAQQEKVKAVFAEQEKKHGKDKPKEGEKPEKGDRQAPPKGEDPRKQEHAEVDAKMKKILTPEQYEKWQKSLPEKGTGKKPENKKRS